MISTRNRKKNSNMKLDLTNSLNNGPTLFGLNADLSPFVLDYLNIGGPVMFVGYHPDDLDFHCSGLAAVLTSIGVDLRYVVVTSGDAAGDVDEREAEQRLSAAAVGVTDVTFLRMRDGKLKQAYFNGELNLRLERVLREVRPAVVVSFCPANLTTISWGAEHPDHRYGALALWEAVYPGARVPEGEVVGHCVKEVLWFGDDLPQPYEGNCFVAVDDVWTRVEAAIRSHESQWGNAEPQLTKARARAQRAAKRLGVDHQIEEYHRIQVA
jgi:LmbE family N-acetylglucosaminyl deacetylase